MDEANDPDFDNMLWLTWRMVIYCRAPQWAKNEGGGCFDFKKTFPGPYEAGFCGWCC